MVCRTLYTVCWQLPGEAGEGEGLRHNAFWETKSFFLSLLLPYKNRIYSGLESETSKQPPTVSSTQPDQKNLLEQRRLTKLLSYRENTRSIELDVELYDSNLTLRTSKFCDFLLEILELSYILWLCAVGFGKVMQPNLGLSQKKTGFTQD